MSTAGIVLCGLLGLFVGSATWVIGRAQAARQPLFGDPRCQRCQQSLAAAAWFPLWGLGLARGCRHCGTAQPVARVFFELLVAAYFAVAAWQLRDSLDLAATLVFTVPLLVVLLVDLWTRFIYTNVIAAGFFAGLIFALADGLDSFLNALGAAIGAAVIFAAFFFIASVIYRRVNVVPFGLGDVFLATMIGTMVGYPDVLRALFLGMLLAGAISILLIVTRRLRRRDVIAYGPYLCLGALLTLLLQG